MQPIVGGRGGTDFSRLSAVGCRLSDAAGTHELGWRGEGWLSKPPLPKAEEAAVTLHVGEIAGWFLVEAKSLKLRQMQMVSTGVQLKPRPLSKGQDATRNKARNQPLTFSTSTFLAGYRFTSGPNYLRSEWHPPLVCQKYHLVPRQKWAPSAQPVLFREAPLTTLLSGTAWYRPTLAGSLS